MVTASLLLPTPLSPHVIFICTHLLINNERLTSIVDWRPWGSLTVGSRGGEQQVGQLAAYCAAKAGVVALTKAIAYSLSSSHMRYYLAWASGIGHRASGIGHTSLF